MKTPFLYDFYIKVKTVDGLVSFKNAQIQVDCCDLDQIFLDETQPKLITNKTAGYKFEYDLSFYFKNLYPNACPLNYKILKIVSGNLLLQNAQYTNLFQLKGNIFEIKC